MENNSVIVKKTRELGTSAGVILPRSWLNKQVVVTLHKISNSDILRDVLDLILQENLNSQVRGIYLYGSYARGDYDIESDIDIMVVTSNTNKLIKQRGYEVVFVSYESLLRSLPQSLNYQQFLKEAKPLLNGELLTELIKKKIKLNYSRLIEEISGILKINKESVEVCKSSDKDVADGIVYSLVLRLRELYMIRCLIKNKRYSSREFRKLISEKIHFSYLRIKRDEKEKKEISAVELDGLIKLSEKWLKELKG